MGFSDQNELHRYRVVQKNFFFENKWKHFIDVLLQLQTSELKLYFKNYYFGIGFE
jgi:hypothetical protein